jgi:hypothetical protein
MSPVRALALNPGAAMRIDGFRLPSALSALSVEAWIHPGWEQVAGPGTSWLGPIVSQHGPGSGFELRYFPTRAGFMVTLSGRHIEVQVDTAPCRWAWMHVAGVWNGRSLRIFVNGVPGPEVDAVGALSAADFPLHVGMNPLIGPDRSFQGGIAELRIWGKALSRPEIAAGMYQRLDVRGEVPELLAYFSLDMSVTGIARFGNEPLGPRQGQLQGADLRPINAPGFAWTGSLPLPKPPTPVAAPDAPVLEPTPPVRARTDLEVIAEKDKLIAERDKLVAEKDRLIAERDKQIADRDKKIAEQEQALKEQKQALSELAAARQAVQPVPGPLEPAGQTGGEVRAPATARGSADPGVGLGLQHIVESMAVQIEAARAGLQRGAGPRLGKVSIELKVVPDPSGASLQFPRVLDERGLPLQQVVPAGALSSLTLDFEDERPPEAPSPKPVPVPDVRGYTEVMARRILAAAGLNAEAHVFAARSEAEIGQVMRQQPAAGDPALSASTVLLFVGRSG